MGIYDIVLCAMMTAENSSDARMEVSMKKIMECVRNFERVSNLI